MKPQSFLLRSVVITTVLGALSLVQTPELTHSDSVFQPEFQPAPLVSQTVYLPLIAKNSCGDRKCWSGMHLGNRDRDWNTLFLQRVDPALGGMWPAAVVVLSDQVYEIKRYLSTDPDPDKRCHVREALVRNPVIFDYVKRAAQAGVRVIIRIYPSPGNFADRIYPGQGWRHTLSYYWPGQDPCGWSDNRSAQDIVDEIAAIHALNTSAPYNFSESGFEPANEPNVEKEWYSSLTVPPIYDSEAWVDMNVYFSAIYNLAHGYHPGVKVLTPPMAQSAYADGIAIEDVMNPSGCDLRRLSDGQIGYTVMRDVYETKNDGVDWHNYWIQGKESIALCPNGQHISNYFPQWMIDAIQNAQKPVTITEADLASPDQMPGINPLTSKELSGTAASIQNFFYAERTNGFFANNDLRIVSWLLNDNTGVPEQDWHEAVYDNGIERSWFPTWYAINGEWP